MHTRRFLAAVLLLSLLIFAGCELAQSDPSQMAGTSSTSATQSSTSAAATEGPPSTQYAQMPTEATVDLSLPRREQIEQAVYLQKLTDLPISWWDENPNGRALHDYGDYNGYAVFCVPLGWAMIDYSTIADSLFFFSCISWLGGYKDGELTELDVLYENGELTAKQIADIAQIHNHCEGYDLASDLEYWFEEEFGYPLEWCSAENPDGVRNYGTFPPDEILLFVPQPDGVYSIEVEGEDISSDTAFRLYVFKLGEFDDLTEKKYWGLYFSASQTEDILQTHRYFEGYAEGEGAQA